MNAVLVALLLALAPFAAWILSSPSVATRAWLLVLSAVPILRITLGGVPIYAIDVLVVGVFAGLAARGALRRSWRELPRGMRWLTAAYGASLTIPLVLQLGRTSFAAEALYGFGRELAALSALLIGACLGVSALGTRRALTWLAAGGAVGGALAIAQRIPALSPVFDGMLRAISPGLASGAARTYPGRSTAFMAAPTALSGFLCIVLLLLLFSFPQRRAVLHPLALILVTGGLLSTYSRQWLPAFAVAVIVAVHLASRSASRRFRRVLLAGLASITLGFTVGPLDVNYFVDRVTATGLDEANVADRLERQRRFAGSLVDQPLTFVAGEGFALQDIGVRQGLGGAGATEEAQRVGYTDNSLLLELANRGFLAAILYTAILLASWRRVMRLRGIIGSTPELVGLMAGLAAAIVLHMFDNYFSEAMFMRMTLWLLIGLIHGSAVRLVRSHGSRSRATPSSSPLVALAQRPA